MELDSAFQDRRLIVPSNLFLFYEFERSRLLVEAKRNVMQ